ncbi:MAG: hypothetical protein WBB28_08030 [Crinalium sp.]
MWTILLKQPSLITNIKRFHHYLPKSNILIPLLIWVGFNLLNVFCFKVTAAAPTTVPGNSNSLATFNGLITLGSILSLITSIIGALAVVVQVTNSINKMKEDLKGNIIENSLSLKDQLIELERDFIKQIYVNKDEIANLHRKVEAGLAEIKKNYELQETKHSMIEKEYTNMQNLVKELSYKLQALEGRQEKPRY